ncbi:hypothetical protein NC651_029454 [Populus alba x Populus x berolinensis]|nr:hypothetical protein NC651_029439 [Populus alba x Populus x berolinensis]KAJ6876465.1 hypothetical protein NC651_029454 [Populus alba x Populus x berolinensis]
MAATDNKAVDVEAGTTKQQVVCLQVDSRWASIKKVYSMISMQLLVWKLSMVHAWFSSLNHAIQSKATGKGSRAGTPSLKPKFNTFLYASKV